MPSNRNKSLPALPTAPSTWQQEMEKLRARIQFLEEVIEILYRQNLQYSEVLNRQKAFENRLEAKIGRMVQAAMDVAALESDNQAKMKRVETQAVDDWVEYCEAKTLETGNNVERYLEDVKQRMIDKESHEIIIGMSKTITEREEAKS
jgi:hypothetical protein